MSADKISKTELISQLFWQMEIGADEAISTEPFSQEKMLDKRQYVSALREIWEASDVKKKLIPNRLESANSFQILDKEIRSLTDPSHVSNDINSMSSVKSLQELRSVLESFDGCSLKNTASNLVFSNGNPDAKIMIIGEAPGKEEDRVGVPFVGQAGQLLNKMLNAIDLDRDATYITNYIPWRPPGNRTPSQEEINIFKPFVVRHIQLKKPDVILALGGVSAKALLEVETGILKLRGHIYRKNFGLEYPIHVLPTLHPAYLLRAPAQKKLAFADLVLLKRTFLTVP